MARFTSYSPQVHLRITHITHSPSHSLTDKMPLNNKLPNVISVNMDDRENRGVQVKPTAKVQKESPELEVPESKTEFGRSESSVANIKEDRSAETESVPLPLVVLTEEDGSAETKSRLLSHAAAATEEAVNLFATTIIEETDKEYASQLKASEQQRTELIPSEMIEDVLDVISQWDRDDDFPVLSARVQKLLALQELLPEYALMLDAHLGLLHETTCSRFDLAGAVSAQVMQLMNKWARDSIQHANSQQLAAFDELTKLKAAGEKVKATIAAQQAHKKVTNVTRQLVESLVETNAAKKTAAEAIAEATQAKKAEAEAKDMQAALEANAKQAEDEAKAFQKKTQWAAIKRLEQEVEAMKAEAQAEQ